MTQEKLYKKMELMAYGINYKTTDIIVREKYHLNNEKINIILSRAKQSGVSPFVVLSTCNRTEFYSSKDIEKDNMCFEDLVGYRIDNFNIIKGLNAIKHLFRVASGLESQVIGEDEILSQIKIAYYKSLSFGLTDKFFNILFNQVLKVARKVRRETQISSGQLSFANIVYTRIRQIFGDNVKNKKFVLIGTGEIAESILNYFSKNEINLKIISGRNYDKALNLARIYKTEVFKFDRLDSVVNDADIIIVATSAPHFLLKRENIRGQKKRIVFDLSVPRNASPDVASEKVILYNLDDLKKKSDENLYLRKKTIPKAEGIIKDEIKEFVEIWFRRKNLELVQDHHFLH